MSGQAIAIEMTLWCRLQELEALDKSTGMLGNVPFQLQALEAALYIVTQQLGTEVSF